MRQTIGWTTVLGLAPTIALIFALILALTPAPARADEQENLFVFVGEKLSLEQFRPELPPNVLMMDAAFKARFRVVHAVYGRYDGAAIEFDAYDHYGVPPFGRYAHSLLFVSRDGERWVQQKYQALPVFRTRGGEWNGCGPIGPRDTAERRGIAPARPVAFAQEAYIELRPERDRDQDARWYDKRHFRIEGDRAYCLTGTSSQDLFELKKRTVLKARGLFGGPDPDAPSP